MNASTDKFKALVHYVIAKCDTPSNLGAIRLNKILWYSDVLAYRETGVSISGSKYLRRKMGPVPANILRSLEQLESEGLIEIQQPIARYQPRLYISREAPNEKLFSEKERVIVDEIESIICNGYTADAISDLSHDDIYHAATEGEEIPMEATLVDQEGDYRTEVMSWADTIISGFDPTEQATVA